MTLPLLASHNAWAGWAEGRITELHARSDGLVYFYMASTGNSRPACASQQPYWMIKDENSAVGKRQLAMLMAAWAAGRPILVKGLGTCVRWSDGEDVDDIVLLG